ncbi:hypothetical protein HPB49_025922 [Dermacentor silvarum]|nr:hypothetical protein HPB49_025922 [Dermacentor silvarum]
MLLEVTVIQRIVTSSSLPGRGVAEQRPLRRVRRQWRFICRSDDSFTQLMTNVMEVNREVLRATAPLRVGDSENLGLVSLRNGRVYNLHTIKVSFSP